jgi:hypothetical protein
MTMAIFATSLLLYFNPIPLQNYNPTCYAFANPAFRDDFSGLPLVFFDGPVAEPQENIHRYHRGVQQIQKYRFVDVIVDDFVQNAGSVTDHNHNQKKNAFSLCRPGFPGTINRKGPGRSKADQHDDFKNMDAFLHFPCFLLKKP